MLTLSLDYFLKLFSSENEQLINRSLVAEKTQSDKILTQIYQYVQNGWPNKAKEEFKNYLATEDNCVYYGNNLIIPSELRTEVLKVLHENHAGIVKMKMIARSYVWWPKIHKDIESFTTSCLICQKTQNVKKEVVETKWLEATYPFERIHLDFFHFKNRNFLIIVDSFSKYVEIIILKTYTADIVIEKLRKFFSVYGLCKVLVSDNGPPFNSSKFLAFCKANDIDCLKSPPYHPQSNGLAERNVQTAKKALIRFCLDSGDKKMEYLVDKYLMNSRHTPTTTMKRTPSELVFSYKQKTKIDIINDKQIKQNNDVEFGHDKMKMNKKDEKISHDTKQKSEEFEENQKVLYRNHFKDWVKWIPATIKQCLSNLRYLILVNDEVRYVHFNQIRKYKKNDDNTLHSTLYTSFDQVPRNKRKTSVNSSELNEKQKLSTANHVKQKRAELTKLAKKWAALPQRILNRRQIKKPIRLGIDEPL